MVLFLGTHLMLGCGGDAPWGGVIQLVRAESVAGNTLSINGFFAERPLDELDLSVVTNCTQTDRAGDCVRYDCAMGPATAISQSAGTIEARRMGTTLLSAPFDSGRYNATMTMTSVVGGDSFDIAAGGAIVPAFDVSGSLPDALNPTFPDVVATSLPYSVSWSASTAEIASVGILSGNAANSRIILCDVPAAQGSVTVDPRLFSGIATGANGAVTTSSTNVSPTRAGDYAIDVRLVHAAGGGAVTFE